MAGEARGAAGLRVADRPLRVGGRGRGEDHAGDDEDERREAEGEGRGDAERVVDGGADVPVGRREERRRAEHPLEAMRATASRHAGRLLSASSASRAPGRVLASLSPGRSRAAGTRTPSSAPAGWPAGDPPSPSAAPCRSGRPQDVRARHLEVSPVPARQEPVRLLPSAEAAVKDRDATFPSYSTAETLSSYQGR